MGIEVGKLLLAIKRAKFLMMFGDDFLSFHKMWTITSNIRNIVAIHLVSTEPQVQWLLCKCGPTDPAQFLRVARFALRWQMLPGSSTFLFLSFLNSI